MSDHHGTPLKDLPGWTPKHTAAVAAYAYTTAEQVVGLAATPGGIDSLASILGVAPAEARRLVGLAREALSPADAAELTRPADVRDFGLGALPPDEQPPGAAGGHRRGRGKDS